MSQPPSDLSHPLLNTPSLNFWVSPSGQQFYWSSDGRGWISYNLQGPLASVASSANTVVNLAPSTFLLLEHHANGLQDHHIYNIHLSLPLQAHHQSEPIMIRLCCIYMWNYLLK